MRIENLEYLLAVVKYGSMNKAARKMFCTQPTITNAIKSLENELGYRLIERSVHGIVPTTLGRQVIDDAQPIVDVVHRWKENTELDNGNENTIHVSYEGSICRESLMNVITETEKGHPGLRVQLNFNMISNYRMFKRGFAEQEEKQIYRIGLFLELPQSVSDGEQYAKEHYMVMRKLLEIQYGVFSRNDSDLMKKERLQLSDIYGKVMIMYGEYEDFPYKQYLDELNIDYKQQVGDNENVMLAVATGDYIAIRPISIAKNNFYVESGIVGYKTFDDADMPINHYVMYPDAKHITKGEKIFVDTLIKKYSLD
jgi:DNA-binding transcriptional LysR family regulator